MSLAKINKRCTGEHLLGGCACDTGVDEWTSPSVLTDRVVTPRNIWCYVPTSDGHRLILRKLSRHRANAYLAFDGHYLPRHAIPITSSCMRDIRFPYLQGGTQTHLMPRNSHEKRRRPP